MKCTMKICFLSMSLFFSSTFPGHSGQVQTELNKRLKGAWMIVNAQVQSACDMGYTNNEVNDTRVIGKNGYVFPPGELVQVYSVDLKRSRVDVHLSLITPYRVTRQDGPFQLFEHRSCGVELQINLPRELVKDQKTDDIVNMILKVAEIFPSREAALDSSDYNGRETEPFPADYEQTLVQYENWKREQLNIQVSEEIRKSKEIAGMVLKEVRESPDYSQGFTLGIRDMLREVPFDCDQLMGASLFSYKKNPTRDRVSREFQEGYEDGQKLAFHMIRSERLGSCFQ